MRCNFKCYEKKKKIKFKIFERKNITIFSNWDLGFYTNLTPCFLCEQSCKGERLQLVEIPRKREENYKKEHRGI
jgi:hypothetical protein